MNGMKPVRCWAAILGPPDQIIMGLGKTPEEACQVLERRLNDCEKPPIVIYHSEAVGNGKETTERNEFGIRIDGHPFDPRPGLYPKIGAVSRACLNSSPCRQVTITPGWGDETEPCT